MSESHFHDGRCFAQKNRLSTVVVVAVVNTSFHSKTTANYVHNFGEASLAVILLQNINKFQWRKAKKKKKKKKKVLRNIFKEKINLL